MIRLFTASKDEKTNMEIKNEISRIIKDIGPGHITPSAYDTAWVARLHHIDEELSQQALTWLRQNQLEDGSWGTSDYLYYHDRFVCTLSAVLALTERGLDEDTERINKGVKALQTYQDKLELDFTGETVGFEMIVPTLLAEAQKIGLMTDFGTEKINSMTLIRQMKLEKAPGNMIGRTTTMAYSSEMAGRDGKHILNTEDLAEANGSIGCSPSATAYYLLYINPKDQKAIDYLRRTMLDGAVPNVHPIDIFEATWSLWNLDLAGVDHALCQAPLDFLKASWQPGSGFASKNNYSVIDSDDSGLVFEVLTRFGEDVELDVIMKFEGEDYFYCFMHEKNPSLSANIHVLGALRHGKLEPSHPSVEKLIRFFTKVKQPEHFWIDKWHASPYYTTCHLILAAAGYCDTLVQDAIPWVLDTQNSDGSWGYYVPSTEETAYCLQALIEWKKAGHQVPTEAIMRGGAWLQQNKDKPFVNLWIGKALYTPKLVVQSSVVSALALVQDIA